MLSFIGIAILIILFINYIILYHLSIFGIYFQTDQFNNLYYLPFLNNHNNTSQHKQSKIHCNILVAHGTDKYSGLATMIYIYGINFLLLAKQKNMLLWIDYKNNHNSIYFDEDHSPNENVFSYFFENIDPHQTHNCSNKTSNYTILSKKEIFPDMHYNLDDDQSVHAWYYHWYHHRLHRDMQYYNESWYGQQRMLASDLVSKYFRIHSDIQFNVDIFWNESLSNAYVLGVHMRGTDKAAHRRKIKPDEYMPYVFQFIDYFGTQNARIFLATDDEQYLQLFRKQFNINDNNYKFKDFVIMQNVVRSKGNVPIFKMRNMVRTKYELGIEVLMDIMLLSKCDWFLHSSSAVSEAVHYNNIQLHNHSIHMEYINNRQQPYWMREEMESNLSCFVLHKFHHLTQSAIKQISLASEQLHGKCFYVVLYWIDQPLPYTLKQIQDIQLLKKNGNELFIVDYENTNKVFPNFFQFMSDHKKYGWLQMRSYPWNMADIPELVWFHYHRHLFSISDANRIRIWMLEYDVGWKGDLSQLYSYLDTDFTKCGMLAYDCIHHNTQWTHHFKHSESYVYNISDHEPYACLIQMVRYVPLLLKLMVDELNENKFVYCESRASMICKREEWCSVCDMYRPRNKYFGVFYSGTSFNDTQWMNILNDNTIGSSFWHRLNTLYTH